MIVDTFDEMLERMPGRPLVMGIALHAYIVGQPYRFGISGARSATSPRRAESQVWFTTAGEIATHGRRWSRARWRKVWAKS